MRRPRFALRTLMIGVAISALVFSLWASFKAADRRSRGVTILVERKSVPLKSHRVIYRGGIAPGDEGEWAVSHADSAVSRVADQPGGAPPRTCQDGPGGLPAVKAVVR